MKQNNNSDCWIRLEHWMALCVEKWNTNIRWYPSRRAISLCFVKICTNHHRVMTQETVGHWTQDRPLLSLPCYHYNSHQELFQNHRTESSSQRKEFITTLPIVNLNHTRNLDFGLNTVDVVWEINNNNDNRRSYDFAWEKQTQCQTTVAC